jgi:hypothetical protein
MKLIACIFCFLFTASSAWGCDCFYNGPFTLVYKHADLVALVQVKRYLSFTIVDNKQVPTLMEVELIKKYKGKESKRTVRVWGDKGNLCRPYLDTFGLAKKFVIAFMSCKALPGLEEEMPQDYYIDACGGYWLSLDEKRSKLTGDFDGKTKQVSLKSFNRFFARKR